jgi:trimeric autotransporter adhesin
MKRGLNKENSLPDPEFGGESSESARAIHYVVQKDTLMTYVSARFAQADPGIVSGSTIERKQMSTKTSFKRIALVAVAALGAGVLSVAPANAASATVSTGTSITLSSATSSVAVGTAVTTTVTFAGTAVSAAACTVATAETYPLDAGAGAQGATSAAGTSLTAATLAAQASVGGTLAPTTTGTSGAWSASSVLSWTPDKAGIYTVTMTMTTAACSTNAADPAAGQPTATWTIYAGYSAAPSTYANTAFPTVGVNTTTGWGATANGRGAVRITNFSTTNRTYFITSSGGSIVDAAEIGSGAGIGTVAKTNGTSYTDGITFATSSATSADAVDVTVQAVGTTPVTVTTSYYSASGVLTTHSVVTLSVGDAPALSVANSTALVGANAGNPAVATVDDVISADATTGTQRANILITLKDQYKNARTGQTLSATVTGPALIAFSQATQATQGTASAASLTLTSSENTAYLGVNGTGVGGVATITISAGTTVIATKTMTFYGAAKTLEAKAVKKFLSVGANADAIEILAKDAAGNIATYTPTALSDAVSLLSSTLSGCAVATSGEVALGYTKGAYYCDVTGVAVGKANLTVAPASTTTNSPVVAFQVTKSVAAKVALSTDKTSYTPGEKITLKITATDADGNPLGSGSYDLLGADSTASQSVTGTALTNAAFDYVDGVATTSFFAPLAGGPVTFSAKLSADAAVATAIQATTITTTATVVESASMQALTTLINSLIAKINALNKLVIKIQKKVRA